jgi:hypothetical protein
MLYVARYNQQGVYILANSHPTQQDLLDLFQDGYARYQKLLHHLTDEEQQIAFTPEGRSVKDFLAHTSHWKAATHKLIVAYTRDQPLPPETPSGDLGNALAHEVDKSLSLPYVRNYWEETHLLMTRLISDELDDNKLLEEVPPPWNQSTTEVLSDMVASICEHDDEHFELIEQYFEIGLR